MLIAGFLKKRIQEGMNKRKAERPFSSAIFETLREKHNTVMNFIKTLEVESHENVEKNYLKVPEEIHDFKSENSAVGEEVGLKKPKETPKKHDLQGNPLKLTEQRCNSVTENLFIGSVYVGNQDCGFSSQETDRSSSWRVRLE